MIHHYATNGKQIVCYFDKAARDKFIREHPEWRLINHSENTRMLERRKQPRAYESRVGK